MKTDDFTGFLDLESTSATALVADGDYDPTNSANWETDLFVAAWEEYTDLTNVMFLFEPYVSEWFAAEACYDWDDVTGVNGTFYSDYYFETGSLGCYAGTVFECYGDVDECAATQPGTDTEIWEPTTYAADVLSEDQILSAILPVRECFELDDAEDFPFM
jgi:hypothetical protein